MAGYIVEAVAAYLVVLAAIAGVIYGMVRLWGMVMMP
jgi:hypothetical protein